MILARGGAKSPGVPQATRRIHPHPVEINRSTDALAASHARQIHSDIIRHIESVPIQQKKNHSPGDGMITATPGLLLAIQTADCLPVIVVDTGAMPSAYFTQGGAARSSASSKKASERWCAASAAVHAI